MSITKLKISYLLFLFTSMDCLSQNPSDSIFQMFVQKEQILVDAIATGDKPVWQGAIHDSCIISIEDGSSITKEKLISDLNPLPKNFTGMIKVIEPKVRIYDNVAVISFINDEYEQVYGQHIHTQYRQTDTWIKMNNEWKMVSMELFEIPKNPPAITLPSAVLAKYAGTYYLGDDRMCKVTVDSGKLYTKKNGKGRNELFAESENIFFRAGDGRVRVIFKKDANGKYMMIERRAGEDLVWRSMKN